MGTTTALVGSYADGGLRLAYSYDDDSRLLLAFDLAHAGRFYRARLSITDGESRLLRQLTRVADAGSVRLPVQDLGLTVGTWTRPDGRSGDRLPCQASLTWSGS